jgi:hypothetical protein
MITPERVYAMLMTQAFYDWHESKFDDHVKQEEHCASKEEIIEDLNKMLN